MRKQNPRPLMVRVETGRARWQDTVAGLGRSHPSLFRAPPSEPRPGHGARSQRGQLLAAERGWKPPKCTWRRKRGEETRVFVERKAVRSEGRGCPSRARKDDAETMLSTDTDCRACCAALFPVHVRRAGGPRHEERQRPGGHVPGVGGGWGRTWSRHAPGKDGQGGVRPEARMHPPSGRSSRQQGPGLRVLTRPRPDSGAVILENSVH